MESGHEWLSVETLAAELGVPMKTVYVWNSKGTAPRAARFGKHTRYRRADVEAWIEARFDQPRPAA